VGDVAHAAAQGTPERARLTAWVSGRVQGVGFRYWVRTRALELGLVGRADNLDDGRVHVVAEGPRPRCEQLLDLLGGPATVGRPGTVRGVAHRWAPANNPSHSQLRGFDGG
jgi:acylphosphatase